MTAHYLDSSALCKVISPESESAALRTFVREWSGDLASSDLARTEVLRHTRRWNPASLPHARALLDSLVLIPILTQITERAGLLEPGHMRSLDALHLATALELGDDLAAVVTYDLRQADAAREAGLTVLAPGSEPHQGP